MIKYAMVNYHSTLHFTDDVLHTIPSENVILTSSLIPKNSFHIFDVNKDQIHSIALYKEIEIFMRMITGLIDIMVEEMSGIE